MKSEAIVYIIDDDPFVRDGLSFQLKSYGYKVKSFTNCGDFLTVLPQHACGCLVLDVCMPKMTGPELQEEMSNKGIRIPIIFLTGYGSIPLVVSTIQAGAVDFLSKPVDGKELFNSVQKALDLSVKTQQRDADCDKLEKRLIKLTAREQEIYNLVIDGLSNKQTAAHLGISYRTVEHHRSNILQKTESDSFLQLVRLVDACC